MPLSSALIELPKNSPPFTLPHIRKTFCTSLTSASARRRLFPYFYICKSFVKCLFEQLELKGAINVELFLTLISGVAWSIVYVGVIGRGVHDRSAAMPLFALGLNFAWESIYTACDILFEAHGPLTGMNGIQVAVNAVWVLLDLVIVCIYFKYGRERFPKRAQARFISASTLSFIACFAVQMAFLLEFGAIKGSQYSAFTQNVVMSILFVSMLLNRSDTRGQAVFIGVAKWIGTLAPALLMGVVLEFNVFIVITGAVCSVFDIIYIVLLAKSTPDQHQEALSRTCEIADLRLRCLNIDVDGVPK